MFDEDKQPPEGVKLGRAKALEVVMLGGGVRLPKKFRVRVWVERRGAREDYFLFYSEKTYHLTYLEFKRRFKILDKSTVVKIPVEPSESEDRTDL